VPDYFTRPHVVLPNIGEDLLDLLEVRLFGFELDLRGFSVA
jgi:hypothetical protein